MIKGDGEKRRSWEKTEDYRIDTVPPKNGHNSHTCSGWGGGGVFVAARLGSQVPQPNRKQHIRDGKKRRNKRYYANEGKKQVSPAIS